MDRRKFIVGLLTTVAIAPATAKELLTPKEQVFEGWVDEFRLSSEDPRFALWDFGKGDFTIEMWMRKSDGKVFNFTPPGETIDRSFVIDVSDVPKDDKWHHFNCTREGHTVKFFVDQELVRSVAGAQL